jgi:predicted nucleotidyltransferase
MSRAMQIVQGECKMDVSELLQEKRDDILQAAAERGAYNIRVFGSVARGEASSQSDLDLLVDLEPNRSLLDLGGLLADLEDLLGCRVDVVTEKGLHWYIRDRVLSEARPL